MIKHDSYIPFHYEPLVVILKNGQQRLVEKRINGYFFLDCTHAMQNEYCPEDYIESWQYVNKEMMDGMFFKPNNRKRNEWATSIIKEIKPNLLDRIFHYFKSL